jgi:hypothetical protein
LAAEDDIAHFVVVAVDRVHMGTFRRTRRPAVSRNTIRG